MKTEPQNGVSGWENGLAGAETGVSVWKNGESGNVLTESLFARLFARLDIAPVVWELCVGETPTLRCQSNRRWDALPETAERQARIARDHSPAENRTNAVPSPSGTVRVRVNEANRNTNRAVVIELRHALPHPSPLPLGEGELFPVSRPTEAVEAGGMIRPLRIAEIHRVGGERVGLQRSPDGIGQIRASIHGHVHTACPTDVESKLIRPHAEAGIVGNDLRFPQCCWTTAKCRRPTRGPRQVIDGRFVVAREHIRTT